MQSYHFASDEQFVENWLQFATFHRTRVALAAVDSMRSAPGAADRASMMLAVMHEYVQAFEDFAMWSATLSSARSERRSLAELMDLADVKWREFFPILKDADVNRYCLLFGLPDPAQAEPEYREEYESTVGNWTALGRAVATTLEKTTEGKRQLLYRVVNKIKHGLLVAALVDESGTEHLYFYPEASVADAKDVWAQEVSMERAEFYTKETFAVQRLLAGTLRAYFQIRFRREPVVVWTWGDGERDWTIERIRTIVSGSSLPVGWT